MALDPEVAQLGEGRRFQLCRPEPLAELFRAAVLRAVDVRAIDAPARFRAFDDSWTPFLGGQGPAPGYAVSLTEVRRAALRDHLRLIGRPGRSKASGSGGARDGNGLDDLRKRRPCSGGLDADARGAGQRSPGVRGSRDETTAPPRQRHLERADVEAMS